MNKFFYLLLIPVLCGIVSCSDDKGDDDYLDNSHEITVVGNWQYTYTSRSSSSSYSSKYYDVLSLAADKTGHWCRIWYSGSSVSGVSSSNLTWSFSQTTKILSLKYADGSSDSYTVSDEYPSGLYLTSSSSELWSREPNVSEILSTFRKWKCSPYKYTNSGVTYDAYYILDLTSDSRGNMEYYSKKTSVYSYSKTDYPFSWTLDAKGAFTINFDDGDVWSFDKVSFVDDKKLYFFDETKKTYNDFSPVFN